jgi:hypothetical protein
LLKDPIVAVLCLGISIGFYFGDSHGIAKQQRIDARIIARNGGNPALPEPQPAFPLIHKILFGSADQAPAAEGYAATGAGAKHMSGLEFGGIILVLGVLYVLTHSSVAQKAATAAVARVTPAAVTTAAADVGSIARYVSADAVKAELATLAILLPDPASQAAIATLTTAASNLGKT